MPQDLNSITDQALVGMYLEWMEKVRSRASTTLRAYRYLLGHWLEFADVGLLTASVQRMETFTHRWDQVLTVYERSPILEPV